MAKFYKILILCIGFTFSTNLCAQNHLDPVDDSRQWAQQKIASLLTPKCRCGIVIAPSFENQFGISLSENCDTLTLIEKKRLTGLRTLTAQKSRKFPLENLILIPILGKALRI